MAELTINHLQTDPSPPKPGKYAGDIGIDIRAQIEEPATILPGHGLFVWGGFHIEFPPGYAGLVLGRSSMNRNGLLVMTGVIDSGYTGEIGAQLHNITCDPVTIKPDQAIAQLVIIPAIHPVPVPVAAFEATERGAQGWGSSGS